MGQLVRYPQRAGEKLQAWDAADEYLLAQIPHLQLENKRILILNDHFGALSKGLLAFQPLCYTDSFVASQAIALNTDHQVQQLHALEQIEGVFDFVFMQIPKNLSFFEDQITRLTHHLHQDSLVLCGFMTKYFTASNYQILEKYIGTPRPQLAVKKAKIVMASFEKSKAQLLWPKQVELDGQSISYTHHSNLFSREKLDIGTRFLLEHLDKFASSHSAQAVLDLGCANGILGIELKKKMPAAHLHFSDDSMMAILSAKTNWQKHFPAQEASFHWTNCFEKGEASSLDLVLCNPPFHQGHAMGDHISEQMFSDAKRCLKKSGQLVVVGNSHLGYQMKLKKIFGNSQIKASNNKFMIVVAQKNP